jgi:hypothetical protein
VLYNNERTMYTDWYSYYKNHRFISLSNILLHLPYIFTILKGKPQKLLEVGCGTADHSVILSYLFPKIDISLLDSDGRIIQSLQRKYRRRIKRFLLCNVLDQKMVQQVLQSDHFHVIYSQGLLEHFIDSDFYCIITNLLPYTTRFVFSIPSENYPTKDFGNELLRSSEQIKRILSSIEGINYKIDRYHPDIGVRTKLIAIRQNRLDLVRAIQFMIFGSCHYIIEITKNNRESGSICTL